MYRSGVGVLKYKGANGKLGTNAMQGGSQAWPSGRHHTDLVNCFSLYLQARYLDKSAGGQIRFQIRVQYWYKYTYNANTSISGRHHIDLVNRFSL